MTHGEGGLKIVPKKCHLNDPLRLSFAVFQLGIDDDTMADEEEEDDGKGPPKLFTMNFVNSYGNAHLEQLNNDDKPLKLTSTS
jgi:hypothetical protein